MMPLQTTKIESPKGNGRRILYDKTNSSPRSAHERKKWSDLLLRSGSDRTVSTVCSEETDSSSFLSDEEQDDQLQFTYSKPKKNLIVRIEPVDQVHLIESHLEYSYQERLDCWYSPQEKQWMAIKIERIVARMEAGQAPKKSHPYRGLKAWTKEGAKALESQVRRTIDGVMDLLEAQWRAGFEDHDALAEISQKLTAQSVEKARFVAYQDEKVARMFQQEGI